MHFDASFARDYSIGSGSKEYDTIGDRTHDSWTSLAIFYGCGSAEQIDCKRLEICFMRRTAKMVCDSLFPARGPASDSFAIARSGIDRESSVRAPASFHSYWSNARFDWDVVAIGTSFAGAIGIAASIGRRKLECRIHHDSFWDLGRSNRVRTPCGTTLLVRKRPQ